MDPFHASAAYPVPALKPETLLLNKTPENKRKKTKETKGHSLCFPADITKRNKGTLTLFSGGYQ
jgi:hypothetical protein